MIIEQLNQFYKGKKLTFSYITTHYLDIEYYKGKQESMFKLTRKAFDKPVQKSFDVVLLDDFLKAPLLFGALEKNKLIGLVELGVEDWNNRMRITNLFILEGHRRKGLGKQLMQKVIDVALSQQRRALVLETQSCNDPAIRFYNSCGFFIAGFDTNHYTNQDIEQKEFRLELCKLL